MQTYDLPPLVVSDDSYNITDLLVDRVAKTPSLPLFSRQDDQKNWLPTTAAEFLAEVISVAKGLVACGVQPGQAVAIMSRTRYEWSLIDFAIWFAGAVSVPIYESSSPAQMQWIISDSDSVAVILETSEHLNRFEQISASVPLAQQVWVLEDNAVATLKERGREIKDEDIERRRKSAKLHDLATLIYTSGTTGKPKGCELLHRGFVELSKNATLEIPEVLAEGGATLMFLPLAHVFARFIEVLAIHAGIRVGHQPDAKDVGPGMVSFKPDFLLAVPRVFEKVYNAAEQKAESGGKGKIFRTAADAAVEYSKALDTASGPSLKQKITHKLFDALVYSKLRAAMGGKISYAISGGAPLGSRLGHFFRAIGLNVLEGYGLTETTAPAMIGRPKTGVKIGKVGRVLPGTGIKIAEDGEIWLRGNNIMRGYWRNPAATTETMHDDWFKTGDIGELDEDGFLSITGRKKELIITAGGKNVSPAILEDPLRSNPLVGQAVVIGDQKPFVAALISLDPEMVPIWLGNNGGDSSMSMAEAAKSPLVLAEIQKAVDVVNQLVSKAESIRKFAIIDTDLSEASGHLTPSLKIKRSVVMKDFAEQVDEIYGSGRSTVEAAVNF
ncbi:MAG: AMP-dependent synthetase/ligase [Rhodoluna sp.]|nr:AMP-dependent synthetase/ligase [Rhodoluna sp.]